MLFDQKIGNLSQEDLDLVAKVLPQIRMLYGPGQGFAFKLSGQKAYALEDINNPLAELKKLDQLPNLIALNAELGLSLARTYEEAKANFLAKKAEASPQGRLAGKIALVTGAAQGLGQGIAEFLAKEGAYLIIADLNIEGAKATAADFCERFGKYRAIALEVNVASEESVQALIQKTVAIYGGLDLLVSNAGVLRSGPLADLSFADFKFVTEINYYAYFLLAKYASPIFMAQHQAKPDYWMDLIQINSKSGLVGSNKNSAYAGSKFAGIGLTQSFALEMVDYHVKVNAICPGNNLDGPLWMDQEKGLFVQYLRAGKVEGAKTIEDVREFYLSKVPIHRGCYADDLGKAICYLVEQEYETGQALPVTGGQEMLH